MGADGGSVAKRSELVPLDKSAASQAKIEDAQHDVWRRCALTGEQLEDPVVSDWDGKLYNKTSILRYLLGGLPSKFKPPTHIRQIRDVVELHRDFAERNKWIDRVTKKILEDEGNSERFGYIAECGHISSVAILSKASCCPICETAYEDTVILNPHTPDAKAHNLRRKEKLESLNLSNNLRPKRHSGTKRSANERTPSESSTEVRSKRVS